MILCTKLVSFLNPASFVVELPTNPFTYVKENLTWVDVGYYSSTVVASILIIVDIIDRVVKNHKPIDLWPFVAAAIVAFLFDWTRTVVNVILLELLCFAFGIPALFLCMGAGCSGAIGLVIQIVVYVSLFFGSFFF